MSERPWSRDRWRRQARQHLTTRPAALLTALAVVLAAGCSASTDNAGSDSPKSCNAPGFSADEIRLGFVYPDSGTAANALAATRSGFVARIGAANAAGGIHGRKLVYNWADDEANNDQNLVVVRDLIERQNVFGLIEASLNASGSADYLREKGIPVAGVPAEPLWADQKNRNMFSYSYAYGEGSSVSTYGDFVKAQGGTRVALIRNDVSAPGNDAGTKIIDSIAAAGIQILPDRFIYNERVTTPLRLGEQLRASGADVVIAAASGQDLAAIMQGVKAAGAPIKIMLTPTGYDRSLLQRYGTTLSGLTSVISYVPFEIDGPARQAYRNAVYAYAPELTPPDQELALVAYILTDLFLDGLKKAGPCPTRASYINNLRASTYDAGGLLPGPVDLTKDFGKVPLCYTFLKVNAGATGYDVVDNPAAPPTSRNSWCGTRLER